MKQIIFVLVLFTSTNLCFAQKLSVVEIIKANRMNSDDFDTYLISMGYTFLDGKKDEKSETKTYGLFTPTIKGIIISASKYFNNEGGFIQYQTASLKEYQLFKQQVKALGYKYVSTDTEAIASTTFNYTKGSNRIELKSQRVEYESGEKDNLYTLFFFEE